MNEQRPEKQIDVGGKILERLKPVVQQLFSEEMIADVEFGEDGNLPDWFTKMYVSRVRGALFGLLDKIESVPLDWWQAFRARWAPRWWLRRHPVKMRDIKLYGAVYFKPSDDPFWKER